MHQFFASLTAFLSAVPAVVWSGLLASFVALGGVIVANRDNTKRLRIQLSHDSEEREKERITAMRKDVYLKFADEMPRVSRHLADIPLLNPEEVNLGDGLSEILALLSKITLICKLETAKLSNELTTRYGETLLKLLIAAQPVHDENRKILLNQAYYERHTADVDRTLTEMNLINESGEAHPNRFAALLKSSEYLQSRIEHFASTLSAAHDAKGKALAAYHVQMLKETRALADIQLDMMVAIRGEFNLESDLPAFRVLLEETNKRLESSMTDFLASLEETVRNEESEHAAI